MKESFPNNFNPEKRENIEINQESKEKQIKIIEIKNGEKFHSLEVESYNFDYPKNIQEETGIIGYERTFVTNDNIKSFIREYNNLDQDKTNTDKEPLGKMLYSISSGEYPNKCFTHEMGADHTKSKKQKDFLKEFVKNKFFLQKIYDLDYIKKQADGARSKEDKGKIFNTANLTSDYESKSHITVFDTQTNEKVSDGEYIKIGNIANKKYFEAIKKGESFACTPDSGLNVNTGGFYFRHHLNLNNKNPFFGFPLDKESYFNNYLNEVLEVYTKSLKNFDWKKVGKDNGVSTIVEEIALSDSRVQELVYKDYKGKNVLHQPDEEVKYREDMLDFYEKDKPDEVAIARINLEKNKILFSKIREVIEEIEKEHEINLGDYNINIESLVKSIVRNNYIGDYELRIPVFIGHRKIPQLSWGHAKYAHYMNEEGLNFFKFKHIKNVLTKSEKADLEK